MNKHLNGYETLDNIRYKGIRIYVTKHTETNEIVEMGSCVYGNGWFKPLRYVHTDIGTPKDHLKALLDAIDYYVDDPGVHKRIEDMLDNFGG
jgi:hypothetical protein